MIDYTNMIQSEIFRHCHDKLNELIKSKDYKFFVDHYTKTLKTGQNIDFKSRFSPILGIVIEISTPNKNIMVKLDAENEDKNSNKTNNSRISFTVITYKNNELSDFDQNISTSVYVFGDDKRLTTSPDLVEQYKSLLKVFFATLNVEYFKLSKKMKEDGVEPNVINCIKDFIRVVNTGLLATSNDQIMLNATYNKKNIAKYIDLL